jgi:hypothetical protein
VTRLISLRERLYQKVLNEVEHSTLVAGEPSLDCSNCLTYPSEVKCCTYEPFIPNFLIGAWITYKLIDVGDLNSNLYQPIGRIPDFEIKRKLLNSPSSFGSDQLPVCHFYKNQKCTVWPFNGARCMTYFCKSSRAQIGTQTWDKIFEKCSDHEFEIAQEVMVYAGIPNRVMHHQLEIVNCESSDSLILQWERHFGSSRKEYYVYCYQKAKEILHL